MKVLIKKGSNTEGSLIENFEWSESTREFKYYMVGELDWINISVTNESNIAIRVYIGSEIVLDKGNALWLGAPKI